MSTIDSLLSELRQAASTTDLSLRCQFSGQLQRLARSVATPRQSMQLFGHTYTEQRVARIAADLEFFTILAVSEDSLRTKDVASKGGGDPILIGSEYRASQQNLILTSARSHLKIFCFDVHLLAAPPGKGNIMIGFNAVNRAFQELPDFL